jgi:hypothetical protein
LKVKRRTQLNVNSEYDIDIKIRDCFSMESKNYVEFCLKEKVGLTIPEAAKKLGILKR